jgi:hypothetical protein
METSMNERRFREMTRREVVCLLGASAVTGFLLAAAAPIVRTVLSDESPSRMTGAHVG